MKRSNDGLISPWDPVPNKPILHLPAPRRVPPTDPWALIGRGVLLGLVVFAILALLVIAGGLGVYAYYASSLPSPSEFYARSPAFKSTKIFDRHGQLLFEVFDPNGGRRTVVPFSDIPNVVIEATISTEDSTFFSNPGVNPLSIARALYRNIREREVVSGASTITQQLVKNLYLTSDRTLSRKVKEAILATEITRRYTKADILEVYLNEVFFGNLAYGIGAASETYFNKPAKELNLPEAALLAGMLQSPAVYDPYTNPSATLARRETVLQLMLQHGYITTEEYNAAMQAPLGVVPRRVVMEAPHFVMYVREQLEKEYGTEVLYKGGLQVYTTLDLDTQRLAEKVAQEKIAALHDQDASNAALVALDPRNGDILAMLGSVSFWDTTIDGQVNVARMPRQPGSTIKPFTYLAALERGWTPATMLMDVKQAFPDGANPPYQPVNYDDQEYGPVSVRTALACSRNIPAVSTLHQIGLPALLEMCQRLGITTLTRPDYGLALTLGGGEVTLLEMTGAYATLANAGARVTPRSILRIEDQQGQVLLGESRPVAPRVVDARLAYLITDILADDTARQPSFGANSPLKLSFPAAAKTGTTNDYRDSWTEGYTPDLVAGVWVGNNNNRAMHKLSGARGAALIWHDFMEQALAGKPHPAFIRPEGIIEAEVCPVSGMKRGDLCPAGRTDLFLAENAPQTPCTVHVKLKLCRASGKLATSACPADQIDEKIYTDYGVAFEDYMRAKGLAIPPREVCPLHKVAAVVEISVPGSPLKDVVEVRGRLEVPDLQRYVVEYGIGPDPQGWGRLSDEVTTPPRDGVLCRWDTRALPDGIYTLRLVAYDKQNATFTARTTVEVRNHPPTPTWTPLPSPTETATTSPSQTPTLLPTATALPTMTLAPSATPPPTLAPTLTILATRTEPVPTLAPSATLPPTPGLVSTPEPIGRITATPSGPTGTTTATLTAQEPIGWAPTATP